MNEFLRYVGGPDLHDGTIIEVRRVDRSVQVLVRTIDGRLLRVEFEGVESVRAINPEGMLLYALSECRAEPPLKRFVFANWEHDDPSILEVVARDMRLVPNL